MLSRPHQLQLEISVEKVSVGNAHSLFLSGGHVYAMGSNKQDQLGIGDVEMVTRHPVRLATLDSTKIVDIAAGGNFSLACDRQGLAFSWGLSEAQALGHGEAHC